MSRYLVDEGVYVVKFKGDICFTYNENQVQFHKIDKVPWGENIPSEVLDKIKTGTLPHTVLEFEHIQSINSLIKALNEVKDKMSKNDKMD